MKTLMSAVVTPSGTQKGLMSRFNDNFSHEDLLIWVYRNCPANNYIKVEDKEVSAFYDDRVETYWLV